jgi:hypothetical protein
MGHPFVESIYQSYEQDLQWNTQSSWEMKSSYLQSYLMQ